MWANAADGVAWAVGFIVTAVILYCEAVRYLGGPKEQCIRWRPDPSYEGAILRGERAAHCKV